MINYKKSLQHQTKYLPMDDCYNNEGPGAIGALFLITMGIAMGCVITLTVKGCDREPMPAVVKTTRTTDCSSCHNKLSTYFKKKGSREPEVMANAVNKTRNPRLLAAISVIESGGNHKVRRTGYKKRHDGAFQVNKQYWGTVPLDADGQAKQAEAILQELTETMPIKKALSLYGGDSTDKYSRRVLAELREVPK